MMHYATLASAALLAAASAAHGGEPSAAAPPPALQPLIDGELRAVTRPLSWRLMSTGTAAIPGAPRSTAMLYGADNSAIARLHALKLLTADVEYRDVVYKAWTPAQDGTFQLPLPATIGEIDIRNIRCGPNDSLNFGSLQIREIDLQNTTITLMRSR